MNLSKDDFSEATKEGIKVVAFSSTHCGPCRMMIPILEDIQRCDVYKFDVYDDLDLAVKMKVDSVPTILFFKDGNEVGRLVGVQNKVDIEEQIDLMEREH